VSTTLDDWIAGARPRTLWTAVTPVLVGVGAAINLGRFDGGLALLALGVALALQVGVNYANDYSDGVRGTDVDRVGPDRLVASGKASPSSVRRAAFLMFAIAGFLGLALVVISGFLWLIAVGAAAIVAAWYYTGSDRPYGYSGWGEASVFVFFGPVATLGTLYVQAGTITWWSVVASVGVGLYAVAMLLVNNIRDVETDALAGKRTFAVRVGDYRARQAFAMCVGLPVILAVIVGFAQPWALMACVVALPALLIALGMRLRVGPSLAPIFGGTSAVGLTYGVLLALGIAL
jgi:1,4-dihydroxy-2-naphthoate octaprenyltransferase